MWYAMVMLSISTAHWQFGLGAIFAVDTSRNENVESCCSLRQWLP